MNKNFKCKTLGYKNNFLIMIENIIPLTHFLLAI